MTETVTINGNTYPINAANIEVLATQVDMLTAERNRHSNSAAFWEATAKCAAAIIAANRTAIRKPAGPDATRFMDALDQGAFTSPVATTTDGWWPYKTDQLTLFETTEQPA